MQKPGGGIVQNAVYSGKSFQAQHSCPFSCVEVLLYLEDGKPSFEPWFCRGFELHEFQGKKKYDSQSKSLLISPKDKPLTKGVLNNAYNIYRRLVNHSTGLMNNLYSIKPINCYACDVNSLITLYLHLTLVVFNLNVSQKYRELRLKLSPWMATFK